VTTAFLSYSHKDRRFVRKLNRDLESLGVTVWLDEKGLTPGDSLLRSIREGIDKSDYFIVVLSEASVSSEWVHREIDVASSIELRTGVKKVIPVLRDPVAIPAMLEGKVFADFRERYQFGWAALRRALGVMERPVSVMVGVLIGNGDIHDVCKYLRGRDYSLNTHWPAIVADVEIATGYYAGLRGDLGAVGGEVSIFKPQPVLDVDDKLPILRRSEVVIAFVFCLEAMRFRRMPPRYSEFRRALYAIGPAREVRKAIELLLRYTALPKGTRYDLEIALKWWASPSYPLDVGGGVISVRKPG
jgi:hypothetical protein